MADTSKYISKADENFYFAAEAGEFGAHQYDHIGPGRQLEMVVRMLEGRATPRQIEAYKRRLPEVMAYAEWDGNGRAVLKEVKTSAVDFVGPGGEQSASTVKGLGLVPLLAGDAIMEGASPHVCAREFFERQTMTSPNESMPFFTSTPYLKANAVGSEANDIAEDVGKNMLKCQSFRAMAKLGKELVEDSAANIKSAALKEIGKAQEMTLNRHGFTKLIDFAGRDVSYGASGNATNMVDAVLYARAGILKDGFTPNKVVLWPTGEYLFFKQLNPYYNPLAQELVEKAGPIRFGKMDYYMTAVSAGAAYEVGSISTAYTFDGATTSTSKAAGSIYAMVADTDRCGRLGILEDLELVDWEDPIKYLEVPIVNTRWDFAMAADDQLTGRTNAYSVEDVYYHA